METTSSRIWPRLISNDDNQHTTGASKVVGLRLLSNEWVKYICYYLFVFDWTVWKKSSEETKHKKYKYEHDSLTIDTFPFR